MTGIVFQNESSAVLAPQTIGKLTLQDDPDVVLIQDTSAPATIQTGIVLVGSTGSITGPGGQAVSGNVPQWANSQGTALGPGIGVGTNPSNLVQLDGSARMPAVDGSQLTNLPVRPEVWAAQPGGRLTLATGTPVMSNTVSGAGTIYYTPYFGQCAPITFDGATWTYVDLGGELNQALSDTTKSPAAAAAGSMYDMFLWWDSASSVYRCTRGPAWANGTTRSLALTRMRGLPVNAAAITNGPGAKYGLWVGTIITDSGGATCTFQFGASASGGTPAWFGVWNTYNRVNVATSSIDSGGSYTYTSNVIRAPRGGTGMRCNFVVGAVEDAVFAYQFNETQNVAVIGAVVYQGLSLNSTSGSNMNFRYMPTINATSYVVCIPVAGTAMPALGFNYVTCVEGGDGANANTFNVGSMQLMVSVRL
jgi:hypothetical protein